MRRASEPPLRAKAPDAAEPSLEDRVAQLEGLVDILVKEVAQSKRQNTALTNENSALREILQSLNIGVRAEQVLALAHKRTHKGELENWSRAGSDVHICEAIAEHAIFHSIALAVGSAKLLARTCVYFRALRDSARSRYPLFIPRIYVVAGVHRGRDVLNAVERLNPLDTAGTWDETPSMISPRATIAIADRTHWPK